MLDYTCDFQNDYVDNLNCQGSSKCGGDSDSTRDTGRGCLEVRTSPVKQFQINLQTLINIGNVFNVHNFRQFCMELNGLAVKLQAECKPETCTQVKLNTRMYH